MKFEFFMNKQLTLDEPQRATSLILDFYVCYITDHRLFILLHLDLRTNGKQR